MASDDFLTPAPASAPAPARVALVLHGGGGPATVAGLAEHLAGRGMHVLTPTHPGWNGTERPEQLVDVASLAAFYLGELATAGHRDVLLVGSSVGGWIAAEMAVRDDAGLVGGLVIVDGVGIAVDAHPIRDFFALDARGAAEYSYHDADRFYVDPASLTEEQRAQRVANMASLRALAGDPYMHDPTLAARLAAIDVPTLVLWGESDRIVTTGYGRELAARIPGSRFELILRAGHLPHLERPEATFAALDAFAAELDVDRPRSVR
ncbi:alpha/beta hydrolase [Catenulispora subtropica]|uniref:Alpha/beta hydrolase n=1 Tax=Catenulispora subtropica TaxID=450798 RepID=A0ABN2T1Y4_9ACTN